MSEHDEQSPVLVAAFKGHVVGVDRRSGEIRWKVRAVSADTPDMAADTMEIAVHGDRVFAAGRRSNALVCIAYPGGEEIGRAELSIPGVGRPTMLIDGGQLFVGREGHVECFTLDGQPLWTQLFDGLNGNAVALGFPGNIRQADERKV